MFFLTDRNMKFLYKLGSYLIFIRKAFSRPEKRSVYTKEVIVEFEKLGLNSIVLVVIISRSGADFADCL